MEEDKRETRKIFVGGLSWATNDESLQAYYEKYGEVEEAMIMKDPLGRSRCFGFVTFKDSKTIESVLSEKNIIDDKVVDAKKAIPKEDQKTGEFKVFIGGIPFDSDEKELRECLDIFGEILEASLVYDKESGKSRGFGFVRFRTEDVMDKALAAREVLMRGKPVEIKKATPKDIRNKPEKFERDNINKTSLYEKYYRAMAQAYGNKYTPEALAAAAAYYSNLEYSESNIIVPPPVDPELQKTRYFSKRNGKKRNNKEYYPY